MSAGAVAVAGFLADQAFGEPPAAVHPVALFGRAMGRVEPLVWADRRWRGAVYAGAGVAAAAAAGLLGEQGGRARRTLAGVAATYVAVAGRALAQTAGSVDQALQGGDLPLARQRLRALVGRRTDDLDEAEVVRAVVESVAENTVDAVVAPLFWAAAGGAPAVLGYRAINTLDAMVGHRCPRYARFGTPAARADDAANWLPARMTAAAVAVLRPRRAATVGRAVRTQAPSHPSPNAGVAEGAFAAALDLRLGGTNDYSGRVEHRPVLGFGRPPERADIGRACRLSRQVGGLVAAGLLAGWRR